MEPKICTVFMVTTWAGGEAPTETVPHLGPIDHQRVSVVVGLFGRLMGASIGSDDASSSRFPKRC